MNGMKGFTLMEIMISLGIISAALAAGLSQIIPAKLEHRSNVITSELIQAYHKSVGIKRLLAAQPVATTNYTPLVYRYAGYDAAEYDAGTASLLNSEGSRLRITKWGSAAGASGILIQTWVDEKDMCLALKDSVVRLFPTALTVSIVSGGITQVVFDRRNTPQISVVNLNAACAGADGTDAHRIDYYPDDSFQL